MQSAINAAQPGDTIILDAGAVYSGDFVLPNKSGSSYITIQSSRVGELPEGVRVGPEQSALFAKLQSATAAGQVIGPRLLRITIALSAWRFPRRPQR